MSNNPHLPQKWMGVEMREIKFRAWNPKKKEMVTDIALHELVVNYCDEFNYPTRLNDGLNQDLIDDNAIFMQFTGLKDRNGIEIWEGDIVRWYETSYTIVEIPGFYYGLMANQLRNEIYEVLGNIYENPELLEISTKVG